MHGTRMYARARMTGLVCIAATLWALGCGGGGDDQPMPETKPVTNLNDIRDLSAGELDTLRAMKSRLNITRDEYWDDRGGVLENDNFIVWYPPGKLTVTHGMYFLDTLTKCRGTILGMFGRVPETRLTVVLTQTMEAYTTATGSQWWHYARVDEKRITYQPISALIGRGLMEIAVPREYYSWAIARLARGREPGWVREGFASELSGEWTILQDYLTEFPGDPIAMTPDAVEAALKADDDRKEARIAHYNAYRMVHLLVESHGRERFVDFLRAIVDGKRLDDAAGQAYGVTYDDLVEESLAWGRGDG